MLTFFCPNCWRETEANAARCRHCEYDLSAYASLPYEDKLIFALGHPIRENRSFAIQALGELRSVRALPYFAQIMQEEQDFYILRETLAALRKFDTPESRELLSQARIHRSRLVRSFAEESASDDCE